jgi:hypothetical protein
MKDVIEATVKAGPFHNQYVQRLLHHTDKASIAARAAADGTRVDFGEILADGTEDNSVLYIQYRIGQGLCVL